MSIMQLRPRSIFLLLCLFFLAACQRVTPTPIKDLTIEVTQITSNQEVIGQIVQTKTFDRCNAAGSLTAEVRFSESASQTTQKALTLTVGAGAEAAIPGIAKAQLQTAVEEEFSYIEELETIQEEGVKIEVPAYTRQEYTIVWQEKRNEGTIEYTIDGEPQIVNYSYRVGLEFDSVTGRNIDCSLPTATPMPTETSEPATMLITATPQLKTLEDSCISTQTWKIDSPDASLIRTVGTTSDGCYTLDQLGILTNPGALHLRKESGINEVASGIYTPIEANSVIEFNIYVDSMSMKFDNIAEIAFAVTPANDRLTARSTARFKLHLEDPGRGKVIHFMMADTGENSGVKLGNQHYEYGRRYNIRLLLSTTHMDVFINGYRINESLELPPGPKAFYIGYDLPVYGEMDITISNITVDGRAK